MLVYAHVLTPPGLRGVFFNIATALTLCAYNPADNPLRNLGCRCEGVMVPALAVLLGHLLSPVVTFFTESLA